MFTLKRFGISATLAGVLAASCASAFAVPVIEVHANWRSQRPKPPAPGVANCTGQPVGERSGAQTAWNDGDSAPLSSRAQRAVHGGGKTDLDGYTGRCRLVDAEHDAQEPLNDGITAEELLKMLEDFDTANRTLSEEEEQELLNKFGNTVHVELDSRDHELHAYIGNGANRQDLGPLSRLDLQQAEEDGLIVLSYDQNDRRYSQNKQPGADLAASGMLGPAVAAVPEPGTYAMLLAGLVLLALIRRRSNGA